MPKLLPWLLLFGYFCRVVVLVILVAAIAVVTQAKLARACYSSLRVSEMSESSRM
jgi:uncharacterized membrane protein YczE